MKTLPLEAVAARSEVESLNRDLCDFDLDRATIEELERRLEMALALPAGAGSCGGCPKLAACGTFCSPPPAST